MWLLGAEAAACSGRRIWRGAHHGAHCAHRARSYTVGAASGRLTQLDVEHFTSIVGESGVVTSAEELEVYNTDWMRKYRGASRLALRPGSTDEVSKILAHCNHQGLPLVPQGGNTGLVGGSVPVADEIVL